MEMPTEKGPKGMELLTKIMESKRLHAKNGCDWVELDLDEFDWLIQQVMRYRAVCRMTSSASDALFSRSTNGENFNELGDKTACDPDPPSGRQRQNEMIWTKEKPQREGFFWLKRDPDGVYEAQAPRIVKIVGEDGELWLTYSHA